MFKDTLEEAFPVIEKFAPEIAEALAISSLKAGSVPLTICLAAIRLLAEVFKPHDDDFSMGRLEERILANPDSESLLKLADEKLIKYIHEHS